MWNKKFGKVNNYKCLGINLSNEGGKKIKIMLQGGSITSQTILKRKLYRNNLKIFIKMRHSMEGVRLCTFIFYNNYFSIHFKYSWETNPLLHLFIKCFIYFIKVISITTMVGIYLLALCVWEAELSEFSWQHYWFHLYINVRKLK